jgi:hypothetical protein
VFVVAAGLAVLAGVFLVLFLYTAMRRRSSTKEEPLLVKKNVAGYDEMMDGRTSPSLSCWPSSPSLALQRGSHKTVDADEFDRHVDEPTTVRIEDQTLIVDAVAPAQTALVLHDPALAEGTDDNLVSAVVCEPPFASITMGQYDSLYNYLHSGRPTGIDGPAHLALFPTDEKRAGFIYHVVTGVIHVFGQTPLAPGLLNLSPFHVMVRLNQSPALVTVSSVEASVEQLARWKAPELMSCQQTVTTETTLVYGMGMLLWEVLTGTVPFASLDGQELRQMASNVENWLPTGEDSQLWQLLKSCVQTDPDARITLRELSSRLSVLACNCPADRPEKVDSVAAPSYDALQQVPHPLHDNWRLGPPSPTPDKSPLGDGFAGKGDIPLDPFALRSPPALPPDCLDGMKADEDQHPGYERTPLKHDASIAVRPNSVSEAAAPVSKMEDDDAAQKDGPPDNSSEPTVNSSYPSAVVTNSSAHISSGV